MIPTSKLLWILFQDTQSDQSEIIVKTVKEVCAEGLVVSGGKDGIFIKEVKPESPASKLSVKEGDQILSATVYFDNVSYEDALQILEHAQPYKMAFCLKRKPPPRTQEDAEAERPDTTIVIIILLITFLITEYCKASSEVSLTLHLLHQCLQGEEAEQIEEGSRTEMRGRRKTKKQHDRISWPKFPTFSRGRRGNFKRSHSTSEAEEQRKLEISPPTSDTESPLKSPLKSPDGKDKKKKHKMKPKKRMAGRRSKSVEETQENEEALATDNMEVLDNEIIMNIVEEKVPMTKVIESPKILNVAENTDSNKTGNKYTFLTLPATESLHKVELISVDTTLKTTDITVALGDDGKERREKSEMRDSIPGKDKYEIETESQLKSSTSGMRTLDPSTFDNILDSPNVISHTEPVGHQVDSDSKPINQDILEKTQESGKTDTTIPKVDVSLDMPEVGPISKTPITGSDKEKKERNILETESYGIRTRGPLADIATSKSNFSNAVNKIDFTSDTLTFEIQTREDRPSADTKKPITPTPVISQPKSHVLVVDKSTKSTGGSTDTESNFKLPKVDVSELDHQESITVRQKDSTKVSLLKREEIEIPGMEGIGSKAKVKSPRIKEQKVENIIKISKAGEKQAQVEAEEFNVEDVKDAVSKFPAFKLPERDITGVLVQREVTIMEIKSDKTGMSPKIPSMSTEINIKLPDTMDKEKQRLSPVATKDQAFVLPKIEQLHFEETVKIESKTDLSKMKLADHQPKTGKMLARDDKPSTSPGVKFKLPKREDIEIPGMEAIEQSVQPTKIIIAKDINIQDEALKDYTDANIKADKIVHEKKSKLSMPSSEIMTPDIHLPGIAIELPIKATSPKSDSGTIKERTTEAKISLDEDNIKKTEEGGLLPDESEKSIIKVSGKTEVEPSELPQAEIKEAESKMKKRKISFPKFGFSKSEVSDANITLPAKQGSLHDADGTELHVESKTTDVEAEFKDSTDSPTKFKLPIIKFPRFGVSFPKTTDADGDIQMPTVSTDEAKLPVEAKALSGTEMTSPAPEVKVQLKNKSTSGSTSKLKIPTMHLPKSDISISMTGEESVAKDEVSKPEVDLSLPEAKADIKNVQKKEIKSSEEMSLTKPDIDASLTGHDTEEIPAVAFSKQDIKAAGVDVSLPVPDTVIEETEMTSPAPEVEVQLKNKSTSGSTSKFKMPTKHLPKSDISISKTGEESVAKDEDDAQSEIKAVSAVASQDKDTGSQDTEPSKLTLETLPVDAEMKTKDTDPSQGSRFMMPKFEFLFSKVKGSEFKKGASRKDAKISEVLLKHDKESAEGKADIPEASVEMEVNMLKMPRSEHEFYEQVIKSPEINIERGDTSVEVGEVDVNLESIQTTDMLKDDPTLGGSQIKFKLPTFKLPKFRSSSTKEKAEIMDLRGEEITLETEDLITSVEPSDVKIDSNVPSQELKKLSISADQTKVDSGDQYTLSITEASVSKAKVYISSPQAKLGEPSTKAEVSQATLESKMDQEVDLKNTGMKMKKPGFSLPKFGFSKPDIKSPEIDVSLAPVDISKPESDLKIEEQIMNTTVSNVEDDQKDTTALGATAKFQLPSINIPKIGGQTIKEEKTIPIVDIAIKGPEVTGTGTQIKISSESPSVDIKRPHLATEGQSVSVDLNVEDAELGKQGGKFKLPKFGVGLPKVKGFDLNTSKKEILIEKPEITSKGMVQLPESECLDVQMKTSPEFGFSKPEVKAPEVDISIQKTDIPTEGSMDLDEANVDIKVSKMESDQKGSTIFGSPTKFKLPSMSLPKFGVKSQKVALDINVADSELEGTYMKTDISKPDVKSEVQPPKTEPKVEGSADMPEDDSKGMQVKVKRPSFSFPKFGFSKPDTANPEVNISIPKAEVSIPEVNVPVKEQTLPGGEAEHKDAIIVSSPTKSKLTEVDLPIFGVKTSKGTVNLPSADEDIKVSCQIQKADLDVKEIETDIHATKGETDVHLAEEKVILPKPDADVQDISIEGKADMPEVDLKGHDVKLKKPGFSLPKLGFSKTEIKEKDVDASQLKADIYMQEHIIPVVDKDAEITIKEEVKLQGDTTTQTKFKLPTINFPKFGLKYPKATPDIPSAEVDIKEPEISFPGKGEVQTTDTETTTDIKGPSVDVDINVSETDDDGMGSKFKLPKFGIGMPKVKEIDMEGKEINIETGLLREENVIVQQPGVEIQNLTIERKTDKVDADYKVKLPEMGFSKPDLKASEVDVSSPKADMGTSVGNVDVSKQFADIKVPEHGPYLKEDTFASPTRFKLPTFSFPKFGTKASKDTPTAHVDIKVPEVSLPDKKFNMSGEVSSVEMKGPTTDDPFIDINIKGDDKKQQEGKFKLPKFGIALPAIKDQDSDQGPKKALTETKLKMSGDVLSIDKEELMLPKGSVEVDVEAKGAELEVEESQTKLPQFEISLQASESPEFDISVSKAEVSKYEVREAGTEKDVVVEEPADLTEMSSKGLSVKMKKPSFGFPNFGFSKSDGKAQDIQASEMTPNISLPGGNTEIGESEKEGKTEITDPKFGSPTKFKLPTMKLPKFGLSTPKVPSNATKADSETKEMKVSSVDYEIETSKVDLSGHIKGKTVETETPSIDINIKEKEVYQEGQEIIFKRPKFGISLPKVKVPEMTVTAKEVKTETPEIGMTEPEIKMQAEDAILPKVDMALEESSSLEKKEVETELKDDTVVSGSPSKFKFPTFKMPKFGISTQKASDGKLKEAEVDEPDSNTELNIEDKSVQVSKELQRESEIKETTEQLPDTASKKLDGDKGSTSKFNLPTINTPKISISRTKSQEGEDDTTTKANAPDAKTETKDDTQPGKSPKFTMPTLEDVLRGFEVEFNVPTIEEMEAQKDDLSVKQDQEAEAKAEETAEYKDKGAQEKSKFTFKFPKLGFSQSSDESDKLVDVKIEESEKHLEASADQKATASKEQIKTEKWGWFKFSFSSPTKTSKNDVKEIIQPPEEAEKLDDVEKELSKAHKEPEKISLSEAVEESLSPPLSPKSSEAFADISSTVTTEQIGMSQTSPTKVKVRYAEPTVTVGVNDVQNDVVTSTARCKLISMEPHQPEKVNIPFLSDMCSASADTLKQMSGEIHVITSNIQAIPETQQASILTNLDACGIHTSPLQVTVGSDSVLTVVETREQSGTPTLVEMHVVKETLHDDKETKLVTQRTCVFEGDSAEPISDETASSICRLRDTVHTEKICFFDSAATIEEVAIVSSETSLRHMESSTDDNGGK
ncbi:protein AHNAK2-like [Carassius gibelio]|uniref:protein AHNAK2-like n=1 Tax=Carassius gibelio TaxID=101364 RepID=UPI002279DC43|nr:protein AHNAK2-like [Carassius gibelio]